MPPEYRIIENPPGTLSQIWSAEGVPMPIARGGQVRIRDFGKIFEFLDHWNFILEQEISFCIIKTCFPHTQALYRKVRDRGRPWICLASVERSNTLPEPLSQICSAEGVHVIVGAPNDIFLPQKCGKSGKFGSFKRRQLCVYLELGKVLGHYEIVLLEICRLPRFFL